MHMTHDRLRLTKGIIEEAFSIPYSDHSQTSKKFRFEHGLWQYFKPTKVDFPWLRQYAHSVFQISSEAFGKTATAFYRAKDRWVICDHITRDLWQFKTHLDVLRTFTINASYSIPLEDAVGRPLPEYGDKLLKKYEHCPEHDVLVIEAKTEGLKPIDAETGVHEYETIPCIMMGYPADLYGELGVSFTLIRFYKHEAKILYEFGEAGSSGSPVFDLEGRLVGLHADNKELELAKHFEKYI